jgi:drug/metabolite transporter (DMT)-like permease
MTTLPRVAGLLETLWKEVITVGWHYAWIVGGALVAAGSHLIIRRQSQRRDQGRAGWMTRPVVRGRKNMLWLIVAAVVVLIVTNVALSPHHGDTRVLTDTLVSCGVAIGVGVVVGLVRRTFPPGRRK